MRDVGGLLILLGIIVALFAFNMNTSVTTSGTFIGGTYVGGGSTHNLGLMQQQMMLFQSGLAAFVAGAFLYGTAVRTGAGTESNTSIPTRRRWSDLRDDETEEERDERVERQRRRERITLVVSLGLVALIVVLIVLSSNSSQPASYSNDELNAAMNDLNAVEMNLTMNDN